MDKKEYELKDHLGNVRAVVGDVKMPLNEDIVSRGVPPYLMDEKAINDYYPYGMSIVDRSWQSGNYKYGYNKGSEKDNEIYTNQEGRAITTFYREGDLSGVRWWSIDPETDELAYQSPYVMMDDNPIASNDPDGDRVPRAGSKGYSKYRKDRDESFRKAYVYLHTDPYAAPVFRIVTGLVEAGASLYLAKNGKSAPILQGKPTYGFVEGMRNVYYGSQDLAAAIYSGGKSKPSQEPYSLAAAGTKEVLGHIDGYNQKQKDDIVGGVDFFAGAYSIYGSTTLAPFTVLDKTFNVVDFTLGLGGTPSANSPTVPQAPQTPQAKGRSANENIPPQSTGPGSRSEDRQSGNRGKKDNTGSRNQKPNNNSNKKQEVPKSSGNARCEIY